MHNSLRSIPVDRSWTQRRISRALVAVVAALTMLSCTTAETPTQQMPERLTAVVLPFLTHMPYFIAQREGFFADEGLEVEFLKMSRSQEFMTALAHGDVDVTTGMLAISELNLIASGARVRAVAAMLELSEDSCTFVGVLARRQLYEEGALDDPERVRDLVFDTDLLTPIGYQLDRFLAAMGLAIDELELVNVPPPAAIGAMASGAIDVMNEAEPFLSQHLEAGHAVLWDRTERTTPGYAHSVMLFGPRLLDERPDLGKRFAAAVRRGLARFAEGKTERNLDIVESATGQPREVLERACWPSAPAGAAIDTAAIREYQQWSVARGLLDRVLEDDELVDRRFFPGDDAHVSPVSAEAGR